MERLATHRAAEALRNQLEVYPDSMFDEADVATSLIASAHATLSEARLQELLHDDVGAVVAATHESSTGALVPALVAGASTVGDGGFPMVDRFADKEIWAVLDSGRNTTCRGEVWAQNAQKTLADLGFDMPWVGEPGKRFIGKETSSRASSYWRRTRLGAGEVA